MIKRSIVFFSTNEIWGGSEILWTQVAKRLSEKNFRIKSITKYDFSYLKPFIKNEKDSLILSEKMITLSIWKRIFNKIGLIKFIPNEKIKNFITHSKPDLAIISQGNNIEGYEYMELCKMHKIPYITVTQLVALSKLPAITDEKIEKFHVLYNAAEINFFVSGYILKMHEKFMGYKFSNARVIYNPFTKYGNENLPYPALLNGNYKVALIGRLENYHKGYDLLIDVLSLDKWKHRNIQFTIYGSGPHLQLIKRLTEMNGIKNLIIKEHIENISAVWQGHHLLMMPSRLEGQSLTLIEAMNFKRAAIVTRVGGVEELVEEGKSGFIADYPAVSSIDDALERAWNRRTEWEQMGITAYHAIKEKHPADAIEYFIHELSPYL